MKIENDKYYTPMVLANKLILKTYEVLISENITEIIEPSAGNGSFSNYLDKSLSAINLNVQLDKSRVEDIVDLLPPIVVEEFNVYKLKKYKFYGDTIGNFTIKGDIFEPDIIGDVFIDNGVLIKRTVLDERNGFFSVCSVVPRS